MNGVAPFFVWYSGHAEVCDRFKVSKRIFNNFWPYVFTTSNNQVTFSSFDCQYSVIGQGTYVVGAEPTVAV